MIPFSLSSLLRPLWGRWAPAEERRFAPLFNQFRNFSSRYYHKKLISYHHRTRSRYIDRLFCRHVSIALI